MGWPRCSDAYCLWQPMTRAPRQLLSGWVAHSRPNRCPEMTWGRSLKKAMQYKGLPVNFKERRAIADGRSEWRSRTYSKPGPPSENCSYRISSQKDTQPSQTCSGGFNNTQLSAICYCFFATGRLHFCPQHWFMCHLNFYEFESDFSC